MKARFFALLNHRQWSTLIILLIGFGVAIRLLLIHFLYGDNPELVVFDERQYVETARNMLYFGQHYLDIFVGRVYAYRVPLYSTFITVVLWAFDDHLNAVRIVQTLVDATTATFIFFIARQFFTLRASVAVMAIYLFYPMTILHSAALLPVSINTLLVTAFVYMVAISRGLTRDWPVCCAALLIGLATLSRSEYILYVPLFLAAAYTMSRIQKKRLPLLPLLFFSIIYAITLSPWIIRNQLVLDQPLLQTATGRTLWEGNYPGAYGDDFTRLMQDRAASEKLIKTLRDTWNGNEVEWNSNLTAMARETIQTNFPDFIKLGIKRIGYTWNIEIRGLLWVRHGKGSAANVPIPGTILTCLIFVIGLASFFLLLVALPAIAWTPCNLTGVTMLIFPLHLTILTFLVNGNARYHLPLVPLLAFFAVGSPSGFETRHKLKTNQHRMRRLVATSIGILFILNVVLINEWANVWTIFQS